MTIDQLAEMRRRWVEANRENGFEEGIKHLLSDLYPDNAHFIYELLQNAEDAGASEVLFHLTDRSVEFEHNGPRLFSPKDVEAITSIGFSTKRDDPTSIGKFGIGFKAVFAYTSAPEIESGNYHFRIRDLVVPDTEGLSPASLGERKTCFVFPFDNPNKPPQRAREEIEENLRELDESTLLFLSNIQAIEYDLPNVATGYLKRKTIDASRIEISVKRPEELVPEPSHYLRFSKDVTVEDADDLKCCRIAVAFGMTTLENQDWKITPLSPGRTCIYFPATKESSGLRFHLHAPFASTVARDSVREDPANIELLNHLANLIAESMSVIRDQDLLDVEFLASLPNEADLLDSFCLPIRERLIEAFNTEKLTPTKQGNHAPASRLYRDRGNLQLNNLIDDKDLAALLGRDPSVPLWAANPQLPQQRDERGQYIKDAQRQNEGVRDFLAMLDISEWRIDDFIEVLETESEQVVRWLDGKPDAWHQELYVLLGNYLSGTEDRYYLHQQRKNKLCRLHIVRCSDGIYRVGSECFFTADDSEHDNDLQLGAANLVEENQCHAQEENEHEEEFHYVAEGVYSSAGKDDQKQKARKFLEDIGVSNVGEAERVKAILKQRYVKETTELRKQHQKRDLERFISLVEDEPDEMSLLFKEFFIFEVDNGDDNTSLWVKPNSIFLDSPYLHTGLKAYYKELDKDSKGWKWGLSPEYEQCDINLERLAKFAEAVGAQTKLEPNEQQIPCEHPEYQNLVVNDQGQWRPETGTDVDYTILEFELLLDTPAIEKSRLIWRRMCSLPERCLKAVYQSNRSHQRQEGHASLVYELREAKWVPQGTGNSPLYERPCDASSERLPEGFQYDAGQAWFKAVEFGKTTREHESQEIQQNEHAKKMGFDSADEAEKWGIIANDLKAQGKSPEDLIGQMHDEGQRRKRLIIEDLSHAEEKTYVIVDRSSRVSRNSIDPRTNLIALYTSSMKTVECQMCGEPMPFKKRNSDEDYFEAVEALGTKYFPLEHVAQYLALCPECAAKYKEHVKRHKNTQEELYKVVKDSDAPEVLLELSSFPISIQFKEKHWQDLKTVIFYYKNLYESED